MGRLIQQGRVGRQIQEGAEDSQVQQHSVDSFVGMEHQHHNLEKERLGVTRPGREAPQLNCPVGRQGNHLGKLYSLSQSPPLDKQAGYRLWH